MLILVIAEYALSNLVITCEIATAWSNVVLFNVEIAEAPFINYNLLPFSRCLNTKALPFTTVRFLESSFFQELDIKNVNSNLQKILDKLLVNYNLELNNKNFDIISANNIARHKKGLDIIRYVNEYCNYLICCIQSCNNHIDVFVA